MINTVMLADNAGSGRINIKSLDLDKATTLIVSDVDALHGVELAARVQVIDRTLNMPLRKYKAIQQRLASCRRTARRELNDETIAEFAGALTAVVEDRLQDALHSGEATALLTAAVLDKLAEQVVEVRNCRFNRATLTAMSEQVLAELPERIRTYRRGTVQAAVVNHVTGPVAGPLAQIGVVHGTPPGAVANAVATGLGVLANTGATRVHVSY